MQHKSVERLFKEQVQHYSNKNQYKSSPLIPFILKWLKDKKPNEKIEICEFGGGAGQLLDKIRKSYPNYSYTNVEIINDYKKFLVSSKINFVQGSVLNSNFKNRIFDVIIMRDVLHHLVGTGYKETLYNQMLALKELKRMVKTRGVIFIEELTNGSGIAARLIYYFSKLYSDFFSYVPIFNAYKNTVVAFISPSKLEKLCRKVFGEDKITINRHYKPRTSFKLSHVLHFGARTPKLVIFIETRK